MTRTRFARTLAAVMALGLVAAACAAEESAVDSNAVESTAVESAVGTTAGDDAVADDGAAAPLTEVSAALQISAAAADGTTIDLADYAGQDLMLWFWAPW